MSDGGNGGEGGGGGSDSGGSNGNNGGGKIGDERPFQRNLLLWNISMWLPDSTTPEVEEEGRR